MIPPRILVFGTFDVLHPGHFFFLRRASERGALFVVVARDETVRHLKGKQSLQNEEERCTSLRRSFPDATILLGDPKDFLAPVREVNPDCILLGYDQSLPPGVRESDLPCSPERLPAFLPSVFKSSLRRGKDM